MKWLEDPHVPNGLKQVAINRRDTQGWSSLHYAARYYRTEILSAALKVEGGKYADGGHEYQSHLLYGKSLDELSFPCFHSCPVYVCGVTAGFWVWCTTVVSQNQTKLP